MGSSRIGTASFVCAAAIVAVAGSTAVASTPWQLITDNFSLVPGCISSDSYKYSNPFDNPRIDDNGNVSFTAVLETTVGDATTASRRGLWYYPLSGSASMIARDGAVATNLSNTNNWRLNSYTVSLGAATGLTSGTQVSPDGHIWASGQAWNGVTGAGNFSVTTQFWTGLYNNMTEVAQMSSTTPNGGKFPTTAPGTAGASWNTAMNVSTSQTGVNNFGQVAFYSTLTGGDVSGTTNNDGIWIGNSSGVSLAVRKGQSTGTALNDSAITLASINSFDLCINHTGDTTVSGKLTVGTGGAGSVFGGAVDANHASVLLRKSSGGALKAIAYQGEQVANLVGVYYPAQSSSPFSTVTGGKMLNDDSTFFTSSLSGAVTTSTDTALLKYKNGVTSVVMREGDAAPWAGTLYNSAGTVTRANNVGSVLIGMNLVTGVGGVDNTNQGALVLMTPTGVVGIARNMSAVNCVGLPSDAVFSPNTSLTSGASAGLNDLNQVVFQATIIGTGITSGVNDSCIFEWDALHGLQLVAQTGTLDSANTLIGAWSQLVIDPRVNGEGTCSGFSDTGWLTWRAADSFGNQALYREQFVLPTPGATVFGALGLLAMGRRRR